MISDDLMTDCEDDCDLCFSNYSCITCIYNYTFNNNEKTCLPDPSKTIPQISTTIPQIPTTISKISTTIPQIPTNIPQTPTTIPQIIQENPTTILVKEEIIPTTFPSKKEIIITTIPKVSEANDCILEEILEGNCNGKVSNDQIGKVYDLMKQKISADANELIETENVIFQISTLEVQKNSNNPNVSSIDLGECEDRLKEQEGLSESDELIVIKTDIKSEDLSSTYVQYEIYNPIYLTKISLEVCENISISVSVPVNLDESIKSNYYSLSRFGDLIINSKGG